MDLLDLFEHRKIIKTSLEYRDSNRVFTKILFAVPILLINLCIVFQGPEIFYSNQNEMPPDFQKKGFILLWPKD